MKHRANSCYFYFPPCTGDPELGVELRLNVWSIWNRHPYPEVKLRSINANGNLHCKSTRSSPRSSFLMCCHKSEKEKKMELVSSSLGRNSCHSSD
jgi:hypothetical protein